MLSINKKKLITGLTLKKHRDQSKLFLAEGAKLVLDLLQAGVQPYLIVVDQDFHPGLAHGIQNVETIVCTSQEMRQISNHKTPSPILAVLHQPEVFSDFAEIPDDLVLVLDEIQDPGNMGTILRLADWFGIRKVICSPNCADRFNPKVVQATMGALARVVVYEMDLGVLLERNQSDWHLPVYGTLLSGENMYRQPLVAPGWIVMGNEGRGIRQEYLEYITHPLLIPNFPEGIATSESLNVATATAIVCAEFRRRMM